MISLTLRIVSLFTLEEKRHFFYTFFASTITGLIQIASIGSIIPFVALLLNPDLVQSNTYFAYLYQVGGFESEKYFFLAAGTMVLLALIIGNASNALTIWYLTRFAWNFQMRLSASLFLANITKPYVHFVNRNSADITKNILVESAQVSQGILLPLTRMMANTLIISFIVVFLAWLSPAVTLMAALVFGMAYGLIYLLVRKPLKRLGERRLSVNTKRFRMVNQAFGSVKEVKLLGREKEFVEAYSRPAFIFARAMSTQSVISVVPRYIIETLAFGLLVIVLLYMLYMEVTMLSFLPVASAFALAGYRVIPALQIIYGAVNALRFNAPVLEAVEQDLQSSVTQSEARALQMPFERELRLDGVSFNYPGADRPSVRDINLVIPRRSFVAFVGQTGAGKTTVVDIILGLLRPDEGHLCVDDTNITENNLNSWQENLGYVPQEIFLLDDTVAANIAFGLPVERIDMAAVENAARIANIHDFILERMPNGYNSVVGERGIRLSGGERQRIGIARALYHDPEILVLDEATSALDRSTEALVHRAIVRAAAVKTVIVIAHRISTVESCDCIFLMRNGEIADRGTFHELLERNADFRQSADSVHAQKVVHTTGTENVGVTQTKISDREDS